MLVAFLTVLGFAFPTPQPNSLCIEVLHHLRSEYRMEVTASQAVNNDTIVYLLVDKSRERTAQIGCRIPE